MDKGRVLSETTHHYQERKRVSLTQMAELSFTVVQHSWRDIRVLATQAKGSSAKRAKF